MDKPCRSCGNCQESGLDKGELIDFITINCRAGQSLKGDSILMYGVQGDAAGQALCEKYSHVGFDW